MKKILLLLIFILSLFSLHFTFAYETFSGDDIKITEKTYGDLYIAGGKLTVDAPVFGDVSVIGGEVTVNQKIEGDLNVIAGTVIINAEIGDDVRVVGGDVSITKSVGGDVIIAGGNIVISDPVLIAGGLHTYGGNIKNSATISGDLEITGGNIDFDGTVFGNASFVTSDELHATKESRIQGDLTYSSSKRNTELEAGTTGKKEYSGISEELVSPNSYFGFSLSLLYSFLFLLGFGVVFYFVLEKFFRDVQREVRVSPFKSFLLGLGVFLLVPLVSFLLLVTIIGIPFGVLFIILYIFLFIFAKLFVVVSLSAYLIERFGGYKNIDQYKKIGIIALLALLFSFIPFVHIILSAFVYGAILTKKYEILKDLR